MLCDSFITAVTSTTATTMPAAAAASHVFPIRYDHDQHLRWRRRNGTSIVSVSASASPLSINQMNMDSSSRRLKTYQEVVKSAREKFTQEISFQSKDKDISLAKALLYIAAEDEAFISLNREMDACSLLKERRDVSAALNSQEWDCVEQMPLAGKSTSQWVSELDNITKDVEAELVSRDIGCHLVELLDAVNLVLFELRGFKRSPVVVDSKYSYLHTVLSTRCGSAILLSIIYIEVCRRLGLTIVGSRVGEDFLIWPQTGNPEELFKVTSGHSLFAIVNGRCVEDPRSKASDLTGNSLLGLEIATKRDIIGIALANLIRLHWKRASRSNPGLMLTSPLRRAHNTDEKLNRIHNSSIPLLRPQDLRLAIMASERSLILQPHNWSLRRDHGMMLYYNRKYGQAVQELSICMAFAPEEEAEVLEAFVEKLHLLRLESSWKSLAHTGQLTVP
uniref:Protein SirB1 N-terminal domain-containing protein n=1 Tax=Salix viminalis TaxID=40686 RepID=A0A6N2K5F4_SALVM